MKKEEAKKLKENELLNVTKMPDKLKKHLGETQLAMFEYFDESTNRVYVKLLDGSRWNGIIEVFEKYDKTKN